MKCNTRIDIINSKYYFHDKIKESKNSIHYIVEDLEYELNFMDEDEQ